MSKWVKDYRYGHNEGLRGDPDTWRAAFKKNMSPEEAEVYLGDDSPWGILGITPGSAFDTIKAAFRKLINKFHPDKWGNTPESNKKAQKIIAAWTTLKSKNP